MQTLKKILFILNPIERNQGFLLLAMVSMTALFDLAGIASILPFVTVLINPEIIETNIYFVKIFEITKIFGVKNIDHFLFVLGVLVFLILILGIAFKALTNYAKIRYVKMRETSIGKILLKGYLKHPYEWFLNRNSADLGKAILSESGIVAGDVLSPIFDLFGSILTVIFIVILLLLVDYKITLITGLFFFIIYGFIIKFTKNFLKQIGNENVKNNELRFLSINEAFGASKEIKIGGLEQVYVKRFSKSAEKYSRNKVSSAVVSTLPRFALEAITFGGAVLIILYLMSQKGGFSNALPVISLFIFASYRLMPAIQNIYVTLATITFASPSLNFLYQDIKNSRSLKVNKNNEDIFHLKNSISLENIIYNYPNTSSSALNNISFNIKSKSTIGIVGPTGCGKTTLVDTILGLLEPQKGNLKIDEKLITNENLKSWQSCIGYVPQNIYLADDTLASNIAFGVNPDQIDQETVEKSSKIANLHDFVINELPKKYQTIIGERGTRLSGGQRQRIGIARALYNKPKLLILDEATSALDNQTEQYVMDAINNLRNNMTIILIAHRLNTVKKCENIILLEKGKIKTQGSYDELVKVDRNFQITANVV